MARQDRRPPARLSGHAFRTPGQVVAVTQTLNRPFRLHWHDFYELVLVTGGRGFHCLDGRDAAVQAGDVLLVTPSGLHTISPRPREPLDLVDVTFDAQALVPDTARLLRDLASEVPVLARGRHDLDGLFTALARESGVGLAHREVMAQALLTQVLVSLVRGTSLHPRLDSSERPSGPDWLPRVLEYMGRHHARRLEPVELAALAHLSPAQFRTRFKQETGQTVTEHVVEVRLRAARALLAATDLPVAQVRRAAGFGNPSHFARAFRTATGCSPSEYRRTAAAGSAPTTH